MLGASGTLAVIALVFMRLQIRPIRLLAKAVDSFGKGRDTGDFRPRGAAEIQIAARAYNLMRQRILRHLTQRTEMLAAVSHDLRTPLTRMRLELELMGADGDPVVAGLKHDVGEMTEVVETYLSFARGEGREQIEPTPLQPIFTSMRERIERQGLIAEVQMKAPIVLPLRPIAFRRCLANLVDNACRYGQTVAISAMPGRGHVEIAVEDDGPGIRRAARGGVPALRPPERSTPPRHRRPRPRPRHRPRHRPRPRRRAHPRQFAQRRAQGGSEAAGVRARRRLTRDHIGMLQTIRLDGEPLPRAERPIGLRRRDGNSTSDNSGGTFDWPDSTDLGRNSRAMGNAAGMRELGDPHSANIFYSLNGQQ